MTGWYTPFVLFSGKKTALFPTSLSLLKPKEPTACEITSLLIERIGPRNVRTQVTAVHELERDHGISPRWRKRHP